MAGPSPSPGPASNETGFMGFIKKNKWYIAGGVGGLVFLIVIIMLMSGGNSSGYSDLSEF